MAQILALIFFRPQDLLDIMPFYIMIQLEKIAENPCFGQIWGWMETEYCSLTAYFDHIWCCRIFSRLRLPAVYVTTAN